MIVDEIRTRLIPLVGDEIDFAVERPSRPEYGDYSTNAALVAAKQQGKNPRELAEELVSKLSGDDLFEKVEVAGPGFVNFTVAATAWQQAVAEILKRGNDFGRQKATGQKVQVEFISANPTGPLTLGNGRGGFGGDVLANVLAWSGHQVEREYYINDAGNQVIALGKTVRGDEHLYAGEYIADLKEKVGPSETPAEAGGAAAKLMLAEIKRTVVRMGIRYDAWFSEQVELHDQGKVEKVLGDLVAAKVTYQQDGAIWLKTTDYGDDKDRVLKKADEEVTYLAVDIAHYYENFVTGKLDRKINILGADHHGYVGRMQAGVEILRQAEGFTGQSDILIAQLVRLMRDGQEVRMSKRAGTYVTLDELLDEVEVDVARFFFVMHAWNTHMDFDLDLAKEQSQKNPVYYVKYAHARISSILKKAGEQPVGDLTKLGDPREFALIRELVELPALIAETAQDYQVQRLPHYTMRLADAFHQFYERCPVISDDADLTAARVALLKATQQVLQNVSDVIGIDAPEKM